MGCRIPADVVVVVVVGLLLEPGKSLGAPFTLPH
jgi:hypothetical protein